MTSVGRAMIFAGVFLSSTALANTLPIETAAKLFGARPSAAHADLSPDGSKMIYIAPGPTAESVAVVQDVATSTIKPLFKSSGKPEKLYRCDFITNRMATCTFGGNVRYHGLLITMTRTVLLDTETGESKSLTVRGDSDNNWLNQFDGRIIDYLPDERGAVLMERTYPGDDRLVGVDRVEVDPLKFRTLVRPGGSIDHFMTDGHGNVRMGVQYLKDVSGNLTGGTRHRYRTAGSDEWKDFPALGDDFTPLTIDRDANALFYLDKLDGRDALYKIALDGTAARTLVAKHPSVDIDGVIRFYPGGPVVGYRYTDDRQRSVYSDPDTAHLDKRLHEALPDAPLIDVVGASRDHQKLLIFASGDTDPGAYYLLDRQTHEMKALTDARSILGGVPLSKVKPVSVQTRDGKSIPAYVTSPAGPSAVKQPVVILPHGGPSARDEWSFDWIAQFLAARGYTVIQPNYRGSSGFGDEFLGENAFKGWRQAMSDIADTAAWAEKSGLADPQRMAIMGWSYGGYAALQSATNDHRYKAVIAIAPVTDLGALRRDSDGFSDAELAKAEIGKGPHLKEGSPLNNAGSIDAPVLLAHGTNDVNVYFAHSRRMDAALRKAGKRVEFLQYKDLDHYLDDNTARIELLTKVGELLDRTIGH